MADIFDLLKRLETEKWSGEIQITSSEGNAMIVVSEGLFIYAYRPIDRAAERIQKLGWIDLPPESILNKTRTWEDFVGQCLQLNPGQHEALVRYFKIERFEVFLRIFFWTNLELIPRSFKVDLSHQPELAFYKPKDLSSLLKEAKTRLKEWPQIQQKVGSSKRYFLSQVPNSDSSIRRLNPDAIDLALHEFSDDVGLGALDQSAFSDEELEIIRLCDGRHSVQDIIRLSPDGEFLTLRRLVDLWERQVILPRDNMNSAHSPSRSQKKSWKDVIALSSLIGFAGLVLFGYSLGKSPTEKLWAPTPLHQALSLYRAKVGRYPVTLTELKKLDGILTPDVSSYEYQLQNLTRYELKERP